MTDEFGEVCQRLNEGIEALAFQLLGAPSKRTRTELRFGKSQAVAVTIAGPRRGEWYDHRVQRGGDGLELIREIKGLSRSDALSFARDWLRLLHGKATGRNGTANSEYVANSQQDEDDAARLAKAQQIARAAVSISDTPAAEYFIRRGITSAQVALLPNIGWRPTAWKNGAHYGAVVFKATDAAGEVCAVQQIYLTDHGSKAPIRPTKRTNGLLAGAAVRFPGDHDTGTVILAEGPENALSVWQSTRQDTWALLGPRWGDAPVTTGAEIILARDSDQPGSPADRALLNGAERLVERGFAVRIATPAQYEHLKSDFNDMLRRDGEKAVACAIADAVEYILHQKVREPVLEMFDAGLDDVVPPPRGWLLGNTYCRRFVSFLIGGGSAGKTALCLAQAVAIATKRNLIGEHVFLDRARVGFILLEDDVHELRRRLLAVRQHHNIGRHELVEHLFLCAHKGDRLLQRTRDGRLEAGDLGRLIREAVATYRLDAIIIDPLVKTHAVEENSNSEMDQVVDLLAGMASELNIAIMMPHHIAKGGAHAPGDADRGRGASAIKDGGRLTYTLTPMSEEEADQLNIPLTERRCFVRMDSAKVNIVPPGTAKWFRLVGVRIGNGDAFYPQGDEVQTLEPFAPRDVWALVTTPVANRILDRIDAGPAPGRRYSPAPQSTDRAAWHVVLSELPELISEKQAKEVISTWIKNGVLEVREYDDPNDPRKTGKPKGLFVNAAKRPG
jgi:hypothetical protein